MTPNDAATIADRLAVADVERRILRACKTLRAIPDREARYQTFRSNGWPPIVRELADAYGYTEATMPRFQPTPHDVSDCLVALAWTRPLEKPEFKLIWWRSSTSRSFTSVFACTAPTRSPASATAMHSARLARGQLTETLTEFGKIGRNGTETPQNAEFARTQAHVCKYANMLAAQETIPMGQIHDRKYRRNAQRRLPAMRQALLSAALCESTGGAKFGQPVPRSTARQFAGRPLLSYL